MVRLIIWRLIQLPFILAIIFIVTFALAWMVPGNPLEWAESKRPPPEIAEAMKRQYNLHSSRAFALSYLRGIFIGSERYPAPDFGPSLQYQEQRVSHIISESLSVSVQLGIAALVVALILGTTAGVIGALWPKSVLDLSSLAVALVGISLPSFVTGSILLVVFAGALRLFPVGGWGSPQQFILPAITLGIAPAAYIARLIRLGLADIMSRDFIRTARAKGLSRQRALFSHAMKVALLPVLSFMGPAAAATMTGSFVVEKIFNVPGIGQHFVSAVISKDLFLILGVVLTFSTMLVLFNLIVDVAYAWFDPRIELE
jgi:oligopeptide transport system permease protein